MTKWVLVKGMSMSTGNGSSPFKNRKLLKLKRRKLKKTKKRKPFSIIKGTKTVAENVKYYHIKHVPKRKGLYG